MKRMRPCEGGDGGALPRAKILGREARSNYVAEVGVDLAIRQRFPFPSAPDVNRMADGGPRAGCRGNGIKILLKQAVGEVNVPVTGRFSLNVRRSASPSKEKASTLQCASCERTVFFCIVGSAYPQAGAIYQPHRCS